MVDVFLPVRSATAVAAANADGLAQVAHGADVQGTGSESIDEIRKHDDSLAASPLGSPLNVCVT